MLTTKQPRQAIRTLRGWAISVLLEECAVWECEEHGWLLDCADPYARERALDVSRWDPPPGSSREQALTELVEVLDSIGDTCPECTTPDR
jgi:hypothetical protein